MTSLDAPAKLTLSLRITGVRDDGFHLIDSEMVSLELADVLTIEESDRTVITVDGRFAPGVPTDGTNLVARALAMAGRTAHVHIRKNVPNGGGLGGGSSDAAAVLRWAGFTDTEAASRLGADIPFCMAGGRARVTGIGETVTPLPHQPMALTLVVPPVHCPTPAVYGAWDELGGPHHPSGNDLTDAATRAVPAMAEWFARISDAAGSVPSLAGSGSTWFLHGHHTGLADSLPGAVVITTNTRPA